jgi:hypothetical protein
LLQLSGTIQESRQHTLPEEEDTVLGKLIAVGVITWLCVLPGCSINRVLDSPPHVDIEQAKVGESRQTITSLLGAPKSSKVTQDGRTEQYEFVSGYSKSRKWGKSILYTSSDIFSFGITELFFDSHEQSTASGTAGRAVVDYGADDLAKSVLVTMADGDTWDSSEMTSNEPPSEPPLPQLPPPSVGPPPIKPPAGRIALVVQGGVKAEWDIPESSLSSSVGRGAGIGAAEGFVAGVQICNIAFFICSPVLAAGGAIIGSGVGAIAAESSSTWADTASAYTATIAGIDATTLLSAEMEGFARKHGYDLFVPTGEALREFRGTPKQRKAAVADAAGILELDKISLDFEPVGTSVNPPRRITPRVHVRLIRTDDNSLVLERDFSDDSGPTRSVEEWMADDAIKLREGLAGALPRLARFVVTELFLQQPFQTRMASADYFEKSALAGLLPITPSHQSSTKFKMFPLRSLPETGLTPTMRWEAFPGDNVTYDLRIWRVVYVDSIDKRVPTRGEAVCDREGLAEPSYTLETALEPSTLYFWSVRAHFKADGKQQVTEWSKASRGLGSATRIMLLGMNPVVEEYYSFKTTSGN